MSYKELIQPSTAVWRGVEEYAIERVKELTAICIAPESSEAEIRQAQAGILEMMRLQSLPSLIKAEAQVRGRGTRKEY